MLVGWQAASPWRGPAQRLSGECRLGGDRLPRVSPSWLWLQGAIVVFVVAGMVIAIVKLA
jgi:hypothetical protein